HYVVLVNKLLLYGCSHLFIPVVFAELFMPRFWTPSVSERLHSSPGLFFMQVKWQDGVCLLQPRAALLHNNVSQSFSTTSSIVGLGGAGAYLQQSMGERLATPWTGRQSITGQHTNNHAHTHSHTYGQFRETN
ncbi:hypothetical protein AMECASPLE_017715, partial [Ameca splendens]